jgi:hypothetical protein
MHLSRQTIVRAGFHFPFLALREEMLGTSSMLPESDEKAELRTYYSASPPHEVKEVFVNPSFTIDDLLAAYRKYPGTATQDQALWLNEQLRKALYGLPDYVYRWFRLGQTAVAMLASATNGRSTFGQELATYQSLGANCGLNNAEVSELTDLYRGLFAHHRQHPDANPLRSTGPVLALLSKLASRADTHANQPAGGSAIMKLVTLTVLMLIGLGGFYLLETQKAVMWLLFVMVAIPPLLAVMFESAKLTGANVVELYRLGLKGIPLIGKLFAKGE